MAEKKKQNRSLKKDNLKADIINEIDNISHDTRKLAKLYRYIKGLQ